MFEEHQPFGSLKRDAIETMVNALWRKQHLSIFKLAAEARALCSHFFDFQNDQAGFNRYISSVMQYLRTVMQQRFEEDEKEHDERTELRTTPLTKGNRRNPFSELC